MAADPELTKAFQQLQVQVLNTREIIRQMDSEINNYEKLITVSEITKKTILDSKPNTKFFISVGRAFALKDQKDVLKLMDKNIEVNKLNIKNNRQNRLIQESKIKEAENNLRDMIAQKKNAEKK